MHALVQSFLLALGSIRSRPGRSALTSLGIIISVASVIAVVSVIQGLSFSVLKSFESLGANVLTIQSQTPLSEQLQGLSNKLSMDDYLLVRRKFSDFGRIVPFFQPFGARNARVVSGSHLSQTQVLAATASYKDAVRVFPSVGRFVSDSDNASGKKVCVVGEEVRKNLKLPPNPVGQFIKLEGTSLQVIGLMEKRGDLFGISQDDYIVIPFGLGRRIAPPTVPFDVDMIADVDDYARINEIQARISDTLRAAHHLRADQDEDFRVQTSQQLTKSITGITDAITLVLGGIVAISLLVSGVGIMNMMMFTVTERTREIGIAKAIGAPRHAILMQFLFEAVILSLVGGVVGVGLGWLIGWIVSLVISALPPPVVPLWSIELSLAFSILTGLVFGVVPAARAADLDPIDALRFE